MHKVRAPFGEHVLYAYYCILNSCTPRSAAEFIDIQTLSGPEEAIWRQSA